MSAPDADRLAGSAEDGIMPPGAAPPSPELPRDAGRLEASDENASGAAEPRPEPKPALKPELAPGPAPAPAPGPAPFNMSLNEFGDGLGGG